MTAAGPEKRYAALVKALLADPDVRPAEKKGFGSSGLFAGGKLFVMLVHGHVVVKLPRERVKELAASGDGVPFDPGHGRLMGEWLSVDPASEVPWLDLAREAKEHAASKR